MHAVLPTKLPREEFYYHYSQLYKQLDVRPYLDLLHAGKMTIENCKQGKAMLDAMADWERYIDKDPVLGRQGSSPDLRQADELVPGRI